jgi:hydroxyacylglutathione hydrolase
MTLQVFSFNPFGTNCFVCHDGPEAVIVDPSSSSDEEHQVVRDYITEIGATVTRILLTHAHIDHILGCRAMADSFGVGVFLHRDDHQLYQAGMTQASVFGIPLDEPPGVSGFLEAGESVRVGGSNWAVLHTPGHSPGSVSFWDEERGAVLSGDVLFKGSIGRTDLWGASLPVLMRSIHQVILPLGDAATVHPGHGPSTTVGEEKVSNPFLTDGG